MRFDETRQIGDPGHTPDEHERLAHVLNRVGLRSPASIPGVPTRSGVAADADPAVTVGAAGAASTISNSERVIWSDTKFRFKGGVRTTGTHGGYTMSKVGWPTDPPAMSTAFSVEFATPGSAIEIQVAAFGTAAAYRIWVDGRIIGGNRQGVRKIVTSGDANYLIKLDWGGVRAPHGMRRIRVDLQGLAFGGVFKNRTDRVTVPARNADPVYGVFLGDSFFEGSGADSFVAAMPRIASALLGWEPIVAAQGSTGYLADATEIAVPIPGRQKLRDRVPGIVTFAGSSKGRNMHVVVGAGYNDNGPYTLEEISAEAILLFQALRDGLPDAELWALGPWATFGPPGVSTSNIGAAVKTAVEAVGGTYIDNLSPTEPWITGTGTVAAPSGGPNGNASLYVRAASDPHPSEEGHEFYGYMIAAAIAAKLNA